MFLPKDHFFLTSGPLISEICKPLQDFIGIKYFDWIRTYTDGSRVRLSNYPEWIQHYFQQEYFKFTQMERSPFLYQSGFSIWDYYTGYTPSEVINIQIDMRDNFDRWHGLSILEISETYMDNFTFTTSSKNEDINSLYLSNLEPLKKFTHFFLNRASELIMKAEKLKIYLPLDEQVFLSPDHCSLLKNTNIDNFYKAIQIKNLNFSLNNTVVILSRRETESLKLLATGKTLKEIAKVLNLSPKTVEYYISNVKEKTKLHTKTELIDLFLHNGGQF